MQRHKNLLFPLALTLLVLLLSSLEPLSSQWLDFDRELIHQGQWWRLITGHWVHLNFKHTLLNLGGLLLVTLIFLEELHWLEDALVFLGCCLLVGLGLLWLTDIEVYVGLSGVLHSLMIYYLMRSYKTSPKITLLGFLGVTAKIFWEQTPWSNTIGTAQLIGGPVAVQAHLLGWIAGLISGGGILLWQKFNTRLITTRNASFRN